MLNDYILDNKKKSFYDYNLINDDLKVRKDINQYFYETQTGNVLFGGNYYIGLDVKDYKNKLNGTTSIISMIFPFAPMISPIIQPWLEKLERRDNENKGALDFLSEDKSKWATALANINSAISIVKEAQNETIDDGNFGELVTLHLLQNNGKIDGLDQTIDRESKINNTIYRKTDRAIEFGKIAYNEIMSLGHNVKLIDYQTPASEEKLWDVGFFDFVLDVDGKKVLIDMKTGSYNDTKEKKTKLQLLGSYKWKFKGLFGDFPDKIYIVAAIQDEIKVGQIKKFRVFGKVIDITNDDEDLKWRKAYIQAALHMKHLYDSGILTRNKQEKYISL